MDSKILLVNQSTAVNGTNLNTDIDQWKFLPIFETLTTPFGVALNAFVLMKLLSIQRSQPPFNLYLINLSISNLTLTALRNL